MFVTLERGYNEGRLWQDEMPPLDFHPTACLEHTHCYQEAPPISPLPARTLAVEACFGLGPRYGYGALCVRFVPDSQTHCLTVRVNVLEEGAPYEDALPCRDSIYIGLPKEYAEGVFKGAVDTIKKSSALGGGTLTYSGAAYGHAGSSFGLFKHLGGFLVSMLTIERSPEQALYDALKLT